MVKTIKKNTYFADYRKYKIKCRQHTLNATNVGVRIMVFNASFINI